MTKNNNFRKTELRSEKVRNIMVEEPPWIVCYGTMLIVVLLGLMFLVVRQTGIL